MDTITHTLFGYVMYKCLKKEEIGRKEKHALLFTAIASNQAPDIDVLVSLTETGRNMADFWHRGLTHSVYLVPVWAALIALISWLIWRAKPLPLFGYGCLGVLIHITSDVFNAWGTGFLEPFSNTRYSIGTINIVDLVFWVLILGGWIVSKVKKELSAQKIFRMVTLLLFLHFGLQTAQGVWLENQQKHQFDQIETVPSFIPYQYRFVGREGNQITIMEGTLFGGTKVIQTFQSAEFKQVASLLETQPKAKAFSLRVPIDLVFDKGNHFEIVDPRFFQADGGFRQATIVKK